jgi:hypothetical protein
MPALRELDLSRTTDSWAAAATLENLEVLRLSCRPKSFTDNDLDGLKCLQHLQTLCIDYPHLIGQSVVTLSRFPALKTLRLTHASALSEDLIALLRAKLPGVAVEIE